MGARGASGNAPESVEVHPDGRTEYRLDGGGTRPLGDPDERRNLADAIERRIPRADGRTTEAEALRTAVARLRGFAPDVDAEGAPVRRPASSGLAAIVTQGRIADAGAPRSPGRGWQLPDSGTLPDVDSGRPAPR